MDVITGNGIMKYNQKIKKFIYLRSKKSWQLK